MKPRGLGAPRSPAPIMTGAIENERRIDGLDARRMGRERADCMVEIGDGGRVRVMSICLMANG
jgi:hypothetical protein